MSASSRVVDAPSPSGYYRRLTAGSALGGALGMGVCTALYFIGAFAGHPDAAVYAGLSIGAGSVCAGIPCGHVWGMRWENAQWRCALRKEEAR